MLSGWFSISSATSMSWLLVSFRPMTSFASTTPCGGTDGGGEGSLVPPGNQILVTQQAINLRKIAREPSS